MPPLTEAGWEKVVATSSGHVPEVRALLVDAVTPEQLAELRTISEQILERAGPDAACPSSPPACPSADPA